MILINSGPSARGWHRLEAAARCEQLYAWGYGQAGSNPERAEAFPPTFPLVRGSLGHVGLAHCYARVKWLQEGGAADSCPYHMPLEAMRLAAKGFGELGEEALPIAVRAVKGYCQHYGAEPFRVLSVEAPAETDFFGYRYTARIDLVLEDKGGKIWIVDHKFVGKIEGKVYRRYILSGQFLGLGWLGYRMYGPRFGGVRLNLIACNALGYDRTTPEAAPWMFERFPFVVKHLEEKIARVEAMLANGEEVPASPSEHVCWTAYGECPAFEMCRWGEGVVFLPDDEGDT